MDIDEDTAASGGEAYRYRNVRPFTTFALAALAAFGALALVAGAQGALVEANQDGVIADPPDLRKVLVKVEDKTGVKIPGMPRANTATADGATEIALSDGDQAFDAN